MHTLTNLYKFEIDRPAGSRQNAEEPITHFARPRQIKRSILVINPKREISFIYFSSNNISSSLERVRFIHALLFSYVFTNMYVFCWRGLGGHIALMPVFITVA